MSKFQSDDMLAGFAVVLVVGGLIAGLVKVVVMFCALAL